MAAPTLSKRARAIVDAVIAAYEAGGSYNTVSQELSRQTPPIDVSVSQVTTIMRRFSPGSIRTSRGEQLKTRILPKPAEECGLTLAALNQMRVGPCRSCGVPLVAKRRENPVNLPAGLSTVAPAKAGVSAKVGGQTCGLCRHFAKVGRAA